MVRGMMIYSNNMEDGEALLTRDLLLRSGLQIDSVSLTTREIKTALGLRVIADYLFSEISLNEYKFLVVPGGRYVGEIIEKDTMIKKVVNEFYNEKKLIAAICAAPRFLGQLGLLDGRRFTCFPGCEKDMKKGIHLPNEKAVFDSNIITGRSVGTVIEFSALIVSKLVSEDAAKNLLKEIVY